MQASGLLGLLLGVFSPCAWAGGAGDLDPTFGLDGHVTTAFVVDGYLDTVLAQPDGKTVSVGTLLASGFPVASHLLARYLPDGTLDPAFGGGTPVVQNFFVSFGILQSVVLDAALQSDGKIVVVSTGLPVAQRMVTRYDGAGGLDPTFGSAGSAFVDVGHGGGEGVVAVQVDGRILIAAATVSPRRMVVVARLLPGGPDVFGAAESFVATGGMRLAPISPPDRWRHPGHQGQPDQRWSRLPTQDAGHRIGPAGDVLDRPRSFLARTAVGIAGVARARRADRHGRRHRRFLDPTLRAPCSPSTSATALDPTQARTVRQINGAALPTSRALRGRSPRGPRGARYVAGFPTPPSVWRRHRRRRSVPSQGEIDGDPARREE